MRDVAKAVMGVGDGEPVDDAVKAKPSLLGKFDFKSLLSKKPAKSPAPAQG